jgi:hypothetical protein
MARATTAPGTASDASPNPAAAWVGRMERFRMMRA